MDLYFDVIAKDKKQDSSNEMIYDWMGISSVIPSSCQEKQNNHTREIPQTDISNNSGLDNAMDIDPVNAFAAANDTRL